MYIIVGNYKHCKARVICSENAAINILTIKIKDRVCRK